MRCAAAGDAAASLVCEDRRVRRADADVAVPDAGAADRRLLERLRTGDEAAFAELVQRHARSMLRLAQLYVPSRAVAEEVVQETWLGVLNGLDGFEGRSSLKTWIFRILVNRAKTRGERERRTVPFAALAADEAGDDAPAVDPDRFIPAGEEHEHSWATPPRRWEESPEKSLESGETLAVAREAIDRLPPMQRLVIAMRDLEGWPSEEVCNALEISETNQRVLLHRARSRVRAALEDYLDA
jgi:RNA polymerase sigma-70 factor (ECF subfamily)